MPDPIRNRIKSHRKVRAGDLVPHEWNFRTHPEHQKSTLAAIYNEVGFARSLLAFELPDAACSSSTATSAATSTPTCSWTWKSST
jgi:hypothetical protein